MMMMSISVLDKTEYDYYDINSKIREQNYRFDNDDEILNSFSKIFKEYDMEYNPRANTRYYRVRYLLNKLKENRMYLSIYIIIFMQHYLKIIKLII